VAPESPSGRTVVMDASEKKYMYCTVITSKVNLHKTTSSMERKMRADFVTAFVDFTDISDREQLLY
jgi:hypothetical protein